MKAVIGLLLLLTVTLLSACSNEPTPEPAATPPTETPVLATEVTLRVCCSEVITISRLTEY